MSRLTYLFSLIALWGNALLLFLLRPIVSEYCGLEFLGIYESFVTLLVLYVGFKLAKYRLKNSGVRHKIAFVGALITLLLGPFKILLLLLPHKDKKV